MTKKLEGKVLLIEAEIIEGLLLVRGRAEGSGIERYPVCVYGKNIDSQTIKEIRGFPMDTKKITELKKPKTKPKTRKQK
jgi:hypothetical protein